MQCWASRIPVLDFKGHEKTLSLWYVLKYIPWFKLQIDYSLKELRGKAFQKFCPYIKSRHHSNKIQHFMSRRKIINLTTFCWQWASFEIQKGNQFSAEIRYATEHGKSCILLGPQCTMQDKKTVYAFWRLQSLKYGGPGMRDPISRYDWVTILPSIQPLRISFAWIIFHSSLNQSSSFLWWKYQFSVQQSTPDNLLQGICILVAILRLQKDIQKDMTCLFIGHNKSLKGIPKDFEF